MVEDKLASIYVHEIMQTQILYVGKRVTIGNAVMKMLRANRDEVIVVQDQMRGGEHGNVLGILTKKDVAHLMQGKIGLDQQVGGYISPDLLTCGLGMTVRNAKNLMVANGIGRLLVKDENEDLCGIVTVKELINSFYLRVEQMEMQLDTILENLHEGVCVIDTEGIVTFWNKSSEKLYRTPKEKIIGHYIGEIFPNALLLEALASQRPFENIKHSPRREEEIVISAVPLTIDGEFAGVVSTDRDISEITKLSNELEKEKSYNEFLQDQMKTIIEDKYSFGAVVGKSKEIVNAITLAKQVSRSNVSVLITGESGTGKEVFARGIHHESHRKGSFVPINCSAIPYNLLESELFGYVEGAFTGALKKGKAGKFELANGGTLFLDEIGDMPMEMQAKLLRVLQDSKIIRVGSEKEISVDVRILAATNKDLKQMMTDGTFRDDLYYRLNVVSIYLPPLRKRKEDIAELVRVFVNEFAINNGLMKMEITSEAMQMLADYPWYGNIRELKNAIERLVILSPNGVIDKDKFSDEMLEYFKNRSVFSSEEESLDLNENVMRLEREMIRKAMEVAEGNKAKAADLLKIKRTTLYYKLKQYEMNI